jgi:regulatory protein
MGRKVTALKIQKRNPNRVNVYLDGEYAFGLAKIVAAWLEIGRELDEAEIERIQERERHEAAVQTALSFLNYKARTEAEVRQRMEKKGFPAEIIEETLIRLREGGLINDRQFAADWVENQSTFRPRGRRMLRYEMHQKGLDEESIQEALESANTEEELAYQAASRKAQILAGLDWQEFRQKLIQFLARRGFSYSVSAEAVQRLWEEQKSREED